MLLLLLALLLVAVPGLPTPPLQLAHRALALLSARLAPLLLRLPVLLTPSLLALVVLALLVSWLFSPCKLPSLSIRQKNALFVTEQSKQYVQGELCIS